MEAVCGNVSVHRQMFEVGRSWVFAAKGRSMRTSGPWIEWITRCLALLSWVAEIEPPAKAGSKTRAPPAEAPGDGDCQWSSPEYGIQNLLDWVEWQFLAPLRVIAEGEAQVYCLTAGRSEYVGFTAARAGDKRKNCTKLSSPIPRF